MYLQRHALTSPAAAVHAWLPHDRQDEGRSDLDCRLDDRVGVVGGFNPIFLLPQLLEPLQSLKFVTVFFTGSAAPVRFTMLRAAEANHGPQHETARIHARHQCLNGLTLLSASTPTAKWSCCSRNRILIAGDPY